MNTGKNDYFDSTITKKIVSAMREDKKKLPFDYFRARRLLKGQGRLTKDELFYYCAENNAHLHILVAVYYETSENVLEISEQIGFIYE